MTRRRAVLLVLLALVLAALGSYLYGRTACPPPDWYVRLFLEDGNFACIAG